MPLPLEVVVVPSEQVVVAPAAGAAGVFGVLAAAGAAGVSLGLALASPNEAALAPIAWFPVAQAEEQQKLGPLSPWRIANSPLEMDLSRIFH